MPVKRTKKTVIIISIIIIAVFIALLIQVSIRFIPKEKLISISGNGNKDYEKILDDFVNTNRIPSLVVGIIDEDGTYLYTYGIGTTENSLFEIGSISKVFTGMMLADAINTGQVQLEDPILPFIEGSVTKDFEYYENITLRNLTTHTSGLPYFPPSRRLNIGERFSDMYYRNFYEDFTKESLYESLDRTEKTTGFGTTWEYSNVGTGLLGVCLSNIQGLPYEEILKNTITAPLGMQDTTIHLSPDQKKRFVQGYHFYNRLGSLSIALKSEPWILGEGLQGAGGIRSTGADMMTFLRAVIENKKDFIADSKEILFTDDTGIEYGMGWEIYTDPPEELHPCILHTGSTGGFNSAIVILRDEPVGFFFLSNVEDIKTDLGFGLLEQISSR